MELTRIPRLAFMILKLLYEDSKLKRVCTRGISFYVLRFKVTKRTILRAFRFLKLMGLVDKKRSRRRSVKRWITCAGISWIIGKMSPQDVTSRKSILIRSLIKRSKTNNLIIKEDKICELFKKVNIRELPRVCWGALIRSRISVERKIKVVADVLAANKKNPIQSITAYFLKSLQNEERKFINGDQAR